MASTNKKSASSKKKTTSSKAKSSKKRQLSEEAKRRQYTSIVLIGVAVLLFFIAIIEGQSVWTWLHDKFYALFGFLTFLVPLYMVYATFIYSKGEEGKKSLKIVIGIGALIVFLCSVLHVAFNDKEYFAEIEWGQQFVDVWNTAPTIKGGGLLGALIGGTLAVYIGKTPAMILWIIVSVCTFLIVTGISLDSIVSVFKKPVKKIGEFASEKIERGAEKREERRERIAAEKEEAEKEKKKFSPPPQPTDSVDDTEEDEVWDAPPLPEEPAPIPEEPVITFIPEEESTDDELDRLVREEERRETPPKDNRRKMKAPPAPDPVPEEAEQEETEAPKYVLPPLDCLDEIKKDGATDIEAEKQFFSRKLLATLESFKIKAQITDVTRGPSVTRYEIFPEEGVRLNKITRI